MALTDEQWKTISERALPLKHRQASEKVAEDLKATKTEFDALRDTCSAAEKAFKENPKGGTELQKQTFLDAQQDLRTKKLELEGLARRAEFLASSAGQMSILQDHWPELCPGCRTKAGKGALEDEMEAAEIAQAEADLVKAKAIFAEEEKKLADRKAGKTPE